MGTVLSWHGFNSYAIFGLKAYATNHIMAPTVLFYIIWRSPPLHSVVCLHDGLYYFYSWQSSVTHHCIFVLYCSKNIGRTCQMDKCIPRGNEGNFLYLYLLCNFLECHVWTGEGKVFKIFIHCATSQWTLNFHILGDFLRCLLWENVTIF
jgi:hypothetical protein